MKTLQTLVVVLVGLLSLTARGGVLPNDAVIDGKTIGEWSAEWWKWVLPISSNNNPMLDTTGAFAAVSQPAGSVFLVAGDLGIAPGPFIRTFTVPQGKYLFFPVDMYEADNVNTAPLTVDELRDQAAGVVAAITNLHASLDGVEISNLFAHRALSPVFSIFYPSADNLQTVGFGGQPIRGLIDPMVSDGYWLMLEPLSVGQHLLTFGGEFGPPYYFFPADIVDYITVLPASPLEGVDDLIEAVRGTTLPAGQLQPLLASLNAARASFQSDNLRAAINQLNAFQNKIRAQVLRTEDQLAEQLIQTAQKIIDSAAARMANR